MGTPHRRSSSPEVRAPWAPWVVAGTCADMPKKQLTWTITQFLQRVCLLTACEWQYLQGRTILRRKGIR